MMLRRSTPLLLACLFALTGCDIGVKTMDAGEYGVVYRALPRWRILGPLRGGVSEKSIPPGTWGMSLPPIQRIIKVDTTLQSIGWGDRGEGSDTTISDYVETRSVDGNEVGLAIEIQFRIDPEKVAYVVQKVGATPERIRRLVSAVARADIRTHMNVLTTSDFFNQKEREAARELLKLAMKARLGPEGILVEQVIFRDYKFERAVGEGEKPDYSYHEQIDETQATIQQVEQEGKKRAALIQQKGQEFEAMEGERKRLFAWANGYARQAKIRGDAYLAQKQNNAAQREAAGMNEVEGMKQRIAALSGPGGEAILRLEIAKALAERSPKFILLNSAKNGGGGIDFNKVDTNQLLRQAGFFAATAEGMKDSTPAKEPKATAAPIQPSPPVQNVPESPRGKR